MTFSAYARDRGIGAADLPLFVRLMNAIDDEWLKHLRDRVPKPNGS
jgi:hypothetical protein